GGAGGAGRRAAPRRRAGAPRPGGRGERAGGAGGLQPHRIRPGPRPASRRRVPARRHRRLRVHERKCGGLLRLEQRGELRRQVHDGLPGRRARHGGEAARRVRGRTADAQQWRLFLHWLQPSERGRALPREVARELQRRLLQLAVHARRQMIRRIALSLALACASALAQNQAPQELIDFAKSLPAPPFGPRGTTRSGMPQVFTPGTEAIYRKMVQSPGERAELEDKARRLFEIYLADAKAGDPIAAVSVSRFYSPRGVGTALDLRQGFFWAKKAAEDGVPVAAIYVGSMYEQGQG